MKGLEVLEISLSRFLKLRCREVKRGRSKDPRSNELILEVDIPI
jgi:hypothetical protein